MEMTALEKGAAAALPGMLRRLRTLVECESPTEDAAAVNRAADAWGVTCNDGNGLSCGFPIDDCEVGTGQCMTIELRYDLENHPRVATISAVEEALPDEMVVRAVVEVEG